MNGKNKTVTELTEVRARSAEEISVERLKARTVMAGYKSTEARLMMELEEAKPEGGTPDVFTNQILEKIDKVLDYQDALIYEARALKAYAKVLGFFYGDKRVKLIKDLRKCAAARLKTKRELESKKDALRSILYGEK